MHSTTNSIARIALLTGIVVVGATGIGPELSAQESSDSIVSDYQRMQERRYAATPVSIPADGLEWTLDTAKFRLESGQIWLQEPTSEGKVTGMVFEGIGRLEISVPDEIEARQLRRFAKDPSLEVFRAEFDRMVLCTTGAGPKGLPPAGERFETHALAKARHEHWTNIRGYDADARLIGALTTPGGRYFRADFKTTEHDWLTFTYDSTRPEEIYLQNFRSGGPYLESWISLDRAEDRLQDGRPGPERPDIADIRHVEIRADLVKPGKFTRSIDADFEADVTFAALRPIGRTLTFYLDSRAEVTGVTDEKGGSLPFLRERGHKRRTGSGPFDNTLVVILPEAIEKGLSRTLTIAYSRTIPNYLGGRGWYPALERGGFGLHDPHTARLVLTTRKDYELRAMGALVEEETEGNRHTSVWAVERPAKMVTFTFARRSFEYPLGTDGALEVIGFGPETGTDTRDAFHDVAADILNSANFFSQLFEHPLDANPLYATLIDGFHGQAFDGFLHLSRGTALGHSPGATELFRAHEVAHQWWGHIVGWSSYRDQWLSEAFAEYSAMIFVAATVEKGDRFFDEILRAHTHQLTGSLKGAFGKFARPGLALSNREAEARIGPIGHGYRAGTYRAPAAYASMSYNKGAYVLHMLRVLLKPISQNDDTFFAVLKDFVATYQDRSPTTADFQTVLTKHAPADWDWFFDQWVYGTHIPSYEWSYELQPAPEGTGYLLNLEVEHKDAPAGWRMPVPVRFEFKGDRGGQNLVMIDQPKKTFRIPLPEKPKKVVFNPDHAVLARVKGR